MSISSSAWSQEPPHVLKNPPPVGTNLIVVLSSAEWPIVRVVSVNENDGSWIGRLPDILHCTHLHGYAAGTEVELWYSQHDNAHRWVPRRVVGKPPAW